MLKIKFGQGDPLSSVHYRLRSVCIANVSMLTLEGDSYQLSDICVLQSLLTLASSWNLYE